jgi:imidazolonepropionase-like amidohydrolase
MPYAIRGARLFDGESADLLTDPVIVVDGECIASIGTEVPEGLEVTDLGDVTLLPGLIDVHVHLCFDASLEPVAHLDAATDDEVLDVMRAAGRTALAAGITTVRDLGDRGYLAVRLRDETTADPTAGPHILAAGPPITKTKGHCWYLGGEADGVEGVRAAVREHAARGVDVIKVMTSGGELTPGTHSHEASYSAEELAAITDEAHRLGLPVTGHAHATQAILGAVAAGFDSIEHCTFFTEEGVDDRPDVLDALAAAGIVVSATLGIKPGGIPVPRIAARMPAIVANFRRMYDKGVRIVVSSDCGIGPQKPYDILAQAAQTYSALLDIPTVVALRAVTSDPARVCRLEDRKGRLAPGYDADILAVAGDPVADIAALQQIRAVYRLGRRIKPRSS